MELKDVMHLYLGCSGRVSIDYGPPMRGMKIVDCVLIGIVGEIVTLECYDVYGNKWDAEHICHYGRFKPILRPLSDITEVEDREYTATFVGEPDEQYRLGSLGFKYLLSKHFDLFGLIENGLAIDSTTLKPSTK